MSLGRYALPSSRILHASFTEANSSRRRISWSVNARCGTPRPAATSLDDGGDLGIGMRRAVALLVAIPAGAGLLSVAAHLRQAIGDRLLAEVRILRSATLAAGIADVETGEIADRERSHRIAEIDHHLVDLLGQAAFLQQDHHLGVERRARAVGDETIGVARHRRRSCRSCGPSASPWPASAATTPCRAPPPAASSRWPD